MNQIQKLQVKYDANRETILAHVPIKQGKLQALIFDMGVSYLESLLQGDLEGYKILSQSQAFWQWWSNAWHRIDAEFIDCLPLLYLEAISPAEMAARYMGAHAPEVMKYCPGNHIFKAAQKEFKQQKMQAVWIKN